MNRRQVNLINRMRSMRLVLLSSDPHYPTRWRLETPQGAAHVRLCGKDVADLFFSGRLVKTTFGYQLK